jgi:hypothetical protein
MVLAVPHVGCNLQVYAENAPSFNVLTPGDPTKGVQLTFTGPTPSPTDPYQCDLNPITGKQYPRTARMQFFCNETIAGAEFVSVQQNSTDSCDYSFQIMTNLVCESSLL